MIKRPVNYDSISGLSKDPRLQDIFNSSVPPVVVFPVSHAVGLSVIRTLEGHDIPILAVDFKEQAAGLYSRHVVPVLIPHLYDSEDIFTEGMLTIGSFFKKKPVLFLVDDEDLFLSLKRAGEFEKYYRLPLSPWPIVETIVDKGKLYRNLQGKGYPIPTTWFFSSLLELDAQKDKILYPVIIKPTFSTTFRRIFGVKAKQFDSYEPLRKFADETLEAGIECIVQEFIPGGGDLLYTFAAYSDDDGNTLSAFTGRKVHQYPPDFGTCRLGVSIDHPELEQLGRRLLKILQYRGISLTEYKKDPQGNFRLIEINPRPGDWPERLAQLCNANLVLTAYRDSIGSRVMPHRLNRFGVKWANIPEDFYYCVRGYRLLGYPHEHRGFFGWLKDIRGLETDAFFSWTDPLPAFVRVRGMFRDFREREMKIKRSESK